MTLRNAWFRCNKHRCKRQGKTQSLPSGLSGKASGTNAPASGACEALHPSLCATTVRLRNYSGQKGILVA